MCRWYCGCARVVGIRPDDNHRCVSISRKAGNFGTLNNTMGISKSIYIGNNPGTNDCDLSIATEKGWTVYQ